MFRRFLWTVAFGTLCSCSPVLAAPSVLITETTAAQHGLTRPWFTQVELDRSRARLCDIVLHDGVLYAFTNAAGIDAIDAETGRTLWSRQVGDPQQPTMRPGISRDLMAVVNGSHLYVLNRFNGELLFEKVLDGAAGAGPALSRQWVYIPMSHGLMTAYRLGLSTESAAAKEEARVAKTPQTEEERRKGLSMSQAERVPLVCQSLGQALVQPLVTRENADEEFILWPTDRGYLNLARIDRKSENALQLKYRMGADAPIVGRPAYLPPDPKTAGDNGTIVAAASNGFVYAIDERSGKRLWRFSTGEAVVEPIVVIEDRVYLSTRLDGMYCLSVKEGEDLWFAPRAIQFVAASDSRVYAADSAGRLLVLNAQNGTQIDSVDFSGTPMKLLNGDTDRIYLADEMGLIQCLCEVEQSQATEHNKERKAAAVEEEPAAPKVVKSPAKSEHTAPPPPPPPVVKKKTTPPDDAGKPTPKKKAKKKAADDRDQMLQGGGGQLDAADGKARKGAKGSKAGKRKPAGN